MNCAYTCNAHRMWSGALGGHRAVSESHYLLGRTKEMMILARFSSLMCKAPTGSYLSLWRFNHLSYSFKTNLCPNYAIFKPENSNVEYKLISDNQITLNLRNVKKNVYLIIRKHTNILFNLLLNFFSENGRFFQVFFTSICFIWCK